MLLYFTKVTPFNKAKSRNTADGPQGSICRKLCSFNLHHDWDPTGPNCFRTWCEPWLFMRPVLSSWLFTAKSWKAQRGVNSSKSSLGQWVANMVLRGIWGSILCASPSFRFSEKRKMRKYQHVPTTNSRCPGFFSIDYPLALHWLPIWYAVNIGEQSQRPEARRWVRGLVRWSQALQKRMEWIVQGNNLPWKCLKFWV